MKPLLSYFIQPLSPLVFRSGKPFGSHVSVADINFPPPSTGAGMLRTQYMLQNEFTLSPKEGELEVKLSPEAEGQLRKILHKGPFLADLLEDGEIILFAPKPVDALYLRDKESGEITLVRLAPTKLSDSLGSDLPKGLYPVMMENSIKGKPQSGAVLWRFEHLLAWQNGDSLSFDEVNQGGIQAIPTDFRTHITIDDERFAAEEGKLFQSVAYDFSPQWQGRYQGWEAGQLGFILLSDEVIEERLVKFGGKGRISQLSQINPLAILEPPKSLGESVAEAQGLRLTLLTPAIFAQGYLPNWLDATTFEGTLPNTNIRVKLQASSMERWMPISGWDMHTNKPKAMRKAVASGAVYWFKILSYEGDYEQLHKELSSLYLSSVSDEEQDQRDGFGLVTLSAWRPL